MFHYRESLQLQMYKYILFLSFLMIRRISSDLPVIDFLNSNWLNDKYSDFYFFLPNTIHWSKLNLSQEMEQLTIIRNRNSANTFSLSNNLQRCKYILYFPASTQSQSQFLQESPDPVNYQEGSLPNCLKGKIVWVSSMEKACFPGGACNKKPFYAQCVKAYNLLLVTIFYLYHLKIKFPPLASLLGTPSIYFQKF